MAEVRPYRWLVKRFVFVHTENWFTVGVPELRSSTTLAVTRCLTAAPRRSVAWQRLLSYRGAPGVSMYWGSATRRV